MMLQIRPSAGLQLKPTSVQKQGLLWAAPRDKPVPVHPPAKLQKHAPAASTGFSRRQLLQTGLLSLLPLSAFGLTPEPAQAHPWEDIPIERLKPFSEKELWQSQAAAAKARPYLLPFENKLLDRQQRLVRQANDSVQQAQTLKAQGKDPRQVLEPIAQKAQRGDQEAQAVLEAMRQYFS